MRVLVFDTCGPVIGVALFADGAVQERTARVTRGAEAHLMPWALELAAEAGIRLAELDGVGAAEGPGAFTGLRVGLAAACGLALSADVPVWTGSSLVHRGLAVGAPEPVLSMLDARKGRVYAAVVRPDGCLAHGPADTDPSLAISWMNGPFRATGEGALAYAEAVRASGGQICAGADDPGVSLLARLAAAGLDRGEGGAPEHVRPVYLRAPDAKPPASMRKKRPS